MIVNSVYILIKKKKVIKLNNIASEVIDNILSKKLFIYHLRFPSLVNGNQPRYDPWFVFNDYDKILFEFGYLRMM